MYKNLRYNCSSIIGIAWLIAIIIITGLFAFLVPRSHINSSILDLLPQSEQKGLDPVFIAGFNARLDQQLVWLVSSDNEHAGELWSAELQKIAGLKNVSIQMNDAVFTAWGKATSDYKYALLDSETAFALNDQTHLDWVISQLYSPFSGVTAKEIMHDPLLLIRTNLLKQQQNAGLLQLKEGWLTVQDEFARTWYFIRAELENSSYSVHETQAMMKALQKTENNLQEKDASFKLLKRGTLYYSDYASEQAVKDISTIGIVSFIGIIVLILAVFRSMLPIWLTLLALSIGILVGLTFVLLIFREVHVITLVMSTTIIGVSIDYALLFLTERMVNGERDDAKTSRRKLIQPLIGALISTVLAYFVLVFAPFAGLQQLAVFAVSGLIAVFLTVILWFPYLSSKLPQRKPEKLFRGIDRWVELWCTRDMMRKGIPLLIISAMIIGWMNLTIDDDVGKLQSLPAHIVEEDQKISQLTGHNSEQRMIVVSGETAEIALRNLEKLEPLLQRAVELKYLTHYRLFPFHSLEQQTEHIALIKKALPLVTERLSKEGISIEKENSSLELMSAESWLESPISEGWRLLWLTVENHGIAIIVPLEGIQNALEIQMLIKDQEGIYWLDRKTEISDLFTTYRINMSWLLGAALVVVMILSIVRFRLQHGIRVVLPILLAVGFSLGALGLLGISVNLFSIMALILVLGMGIDYSLFFSNREGEASVSMLTIIAAAMISELTFGLLAFSHTTAIVGFGVVLAVGVFTALLLSPLAIPLDQKR